MAYSFHIFTPFLICLRLLRRFEHFQLLKSAFMAALQVVSPMALGGTANSPNFQEDFSLLGAVPANIVIGKHIGNHTLTGAFCSSICQRLPLMRCIFAISGRP